MKNKARYENGILVLPKPGIGRPLKVQYEIGKKYGKLTVLERIPHKHGYICLICTCDCGNQTTVLWNNLWSGKSDSCGCSRIRIKDRSQAVYNRSFSQYKAAAKHRNLVWELTKEEFQKLILSPCFYCGEAPTRPILPMVNKRFTARKPQVKGEWPEIWANGVDRRNNDLGYTVSNSVPCCYTCNRTKWTLTEEQFLGWASKVYRHSLEFLKE